MSILQTMPMLSHPRLSHVRPILETSEVGAKVAAKLDELPMRVLIVPPPSGAPAPVQDFYAKYAKSAAYHPAANALILPETHLFPEGLKMGDRLLPGSSPEELAVTLAHEGVHRIQRGTTQEWMRTISVDEPREAAMSVVNAVLETDSGTKLPARVLRGLDDVALGDEVEAYHLHSQIARDLGVEGRYINPDGSIMSPDEILDDVRSMRPYRIQATLKQVSWAAQGLEAARRGVRGLKTATSSITSRAAGGQ